MRSLRVWLILLSMKTLVVVMSFISNIKALLHPAGGHQGSHKAHQAGNPTL